MVSAGLGNIIAVQLGLLEMLVENIRECVLGGYLISMIPLTKKRNIVSTP
jgi:hypothetical protein